MSFFYTSSVELLDLLSCFRGFACTALSFQNILNTTLHLTISAHPPKILLQAFSELLEYGVRLAIPAFALMPPYLSLLHLLA